MQSSHFPWSSSFYGWSKYMTSLTKDIIVLSTALLLLKAQTYITLTTRVFRYVHVWSFEGLNFDELFCQNWHVYRCIFVGIPWKSSYIDQIEVVFCASPHFVAQWSYICYMISPCSNIREFEDNSLQTWWSLRNMFLDHILFMNNLQTTPSEIHNTR